MTVGNSIYVATESLYDEQSNTYTVTASSGDRFSVVVSENEGVKTVVITKIQEDEQASQQ